MFLQRAGRLPGHASSDLLLASQPWPQHRSTTTCLAAAAANAGKSSHPRQRPRDLDEGWEVIPSAPSAPSPAPSPSPSTYLASADGAEDGWGVASSSPPSPSATAHKSAPTARRGNAGPPAAQTGSLPQTPGSKSVKARKARGPAVNLNSDQGTLALALLQARIRLGDGKPMQPAELAALKTRVDEVKAAKAAAAPAGGGKPSLLATAQQAGLAPRKKAGKIVYVDDDDNIIGEEDEDEEVTDSSSLAFSLTIGEEGTEFAEFDASGKVRRRTTRALPASGIDGEYEGDEGGDAEDGEELSAEELAEFEQELDAQVADPDELDFSGGAAAGAGWEQLRSMQRAAVAVSALESAAARQSAPQRSKATKSQKLLLEGVADGTDLVLGAKDVEALLGEEGTSGAGLLLGGQDQQDEQQEWGLEEIRDRRSETLMEQLGVVKRRRGVVPTAAPGADDDTQGQPGRRFPGSRTMQQDEATVQWGGTGLQGIPAGADLEEQEALLNRMFKPHKVKELMAHQRAAYKATLDLKQGKGAKGKFGDEAKLHRQLRIISGAAAGKRLLSSRGEQTRPMMEKVRAAIFNMILSQCGAGASLPAGSRWLDLFAGTGSVGLEALSRGAGMTHFVEMDPWVCRNVLGSNITTCGFNKRCIVHASKAEEFLKKAKALPRFAGGAFDFISMCPPYLLVSYPELFSLLEGSPLVHDRTILFVEYPKQLSYQVPDTVGPLDAVRDRKYGRTWVRVYAAPSQAGAEDDEEDEMSWVAEDEDEEHI